MLNKKIFIVAFASITGIGALGGLIKASDTGIFNSIFAATHSSSCQWNHYEGKAQTYNESGYKEYWICCNHSELGYVFQEPTTGTITDQNHTAETLSYIKYGDPRYLPSYYEGVNFEDGQIPTFITSNASNSTFEVVQESSLKGSYVLKLEGKANYGFNLIPEYLTAVFSDPSVTAISFDAKGTGSTNDFRRHAGYLSKNICYELNDSKYGINQTWKTFYYTREYFENKHANDIFLICGGYSDCPTIYIDNIHAVKEDITPYSFDNGRIDITNSGTRKVEAFSAGHSSSGLEHIVSNQYFSMTDSSNVVTDISLDTNRKTHETYSLKVTKNNGYLAFSISSKGKSLVGGGYMTIDIYSTIRVNGNKDTRNFIDGYNNPTLTGNLGYHPANTWVTYTIHDNQIDPSGRFLIIQGSSAGEYYFDNITFHYSVHGNGCTWTHYDRVEPSSTTNGVKEYWVCTAHGNEISMTEPTTGTIINGTHEEGFASTISPEDERYLEPYSASNLTFEDGEVPSAIIPNDVNRSTTVVEDSSSHNGSHVLKIESDGARGQFGFNLSKNYLDVMFENPDVKAIAFDARSDAQSNDFRRRAGYKSTNITYEANSTGYGLYTMYKTYYYTREYYNNYHANDTFLICGDPSIGYYYVDNIRAVTNISYYGFENGRFVHDTTTNNLEIYSPGHGTNNGVEAISSFAYFRLRPHNASIISNYVIEQSQVSEGYYSCKFTKTNGEIGIYTANDIKSRIGANGTVSFDLYSTVAVNGNASVKNFIDGNRNPTLTGDLGYHPANRWVRYTVSPSQITSDGRMLIILGSSAGSFYIDNIEINYAA